MAATAVTFLSAATLSSPVLAQDCKPIKPVASMKGVVDSGGRMLVPVTMNGNPNYLMLATYSTETIVGNAARDFNLPIRKSVGNVVRTDGSLINQYALTKEFKLGQITMTGDIAFFVEEDNPDYKTNKYGGTIGLYYLVAHDIDIDYGNGLLNLIDPDHCPGNVLYWKPSVVSVIPIIYDSVGNITLKVKLDGVELWAVLATENSGTTLNLDVAKDKLKFDPAAPDLEKSGDDKFPVYRKRFATLEMNGLVVSNPQVSIIPDKIRKRIDQHTTGTSTQIDDAKLNEIMLGANILSKLHVYIAVKEKKLYISPLPAPKAAAPPN